MGSGSWEVFSLLHCTLSCPGMAYIKWSRVTRIESLKHSPQTSMREVFAKTFLKLSSSSPPPQLFWAGTSDEPWHRRSLEKFYHKFCSLRTAACVQTPSPPPLFWWICTVISAALILLSVQNSRHFQSPPDDWGPNKELQLKLEFPTLK